MNHNIDISSDSEHFVIPKSLHVEVQVKLYKTFLLVYKYLFRTDLQLKTKHNIRLDSDQLYVSKTVYYYTVFYFLAVGLNKIFTHQEKNCIQSYLYSSM